MKSISPNLNIMIKAAKEAGKLSKLLQKTKLSVSYLDVESYAKDKASGTPNILIDDRPVNVERWQGAGGYGILYQANRDSLTKVKEALENYGKQNRDEQ